MRAKGVATLRDLILRGETSARKLLEGSGLEGVEGGGRTGRSGPSGEVGISFSEWLGRSRPIGGTKLLVRDVEVSSCHSGSTPRLWRSVRCCCL